MNDPLRPDEYPTAYEHPRTAAQVRRYLRNSVGQLVGGTVAALVGGPLLFGGGLEPRANDTVVTVVLSAVGWLVLAGFVSTLRGLRMRRYLRRHPWTRRPGVYRIGASSRGNGWPALLLHAHDGRPETVVAPTGYVWRFQSLGTGEHEFLVAGPLPRWCVVSLGSVETVVFARRPLLLRRRLRRTALDATGR